MIPAIIIQIAAGLYEIKLGALHPTRDFNYVKDTVAGFIAAARSPKAIGEIINLGSNMKSIGDTANLIAEIMGRKINIISDKPCFRPEKSEVETEGRQLESQELGWQPAYGGLAGFKRGLMETIDWFSNPDHLAWYKEGIYNI